MKASKWWRLLALLMVSCLALTCLCACGEDDEFVNPDVPGETLSGWPSDAIFSTVPQFEAGVFDETQSVLKAGNSLLFFNEVEQSDYDVYYQALVDAGFVDAMSASGGTTVKNARFNNADNTVMVSLNYRSMNKLLKITLVEVVPSDEDGDE